MRMTEKVERLVNSRWAYWVGTGVILLAFAYVRADILESVDVKYITKERMLIHEKQNEEAANTISALRTLMESNRLTLKEVSVNLAHLSEELKKAHP